MPKYTTSNIEETVLHYFPFSKPNPGQLEAINLIVDAFLNQNKKHVIASLPTGIGKSVVATTVHHTIAHLLRDRFRTTITTGTKGLQDQYLATDGSIDDIRAKTNYSCPFGKGPYNSGSCRSQLSSGRCNKSQMCPYIKKREKWCNVSNLRLTNTSFQIEAPASLCMLPQNKADLLVLDECHDLDDAIIEHATIKLNLSDFTKTKTQDKGEFLTALDDYIHLFRAIPVGDSFTINSDMYDGMKKLSDLVKELLKVLDKKMKKAANDKLGILIESLQGIQDKTDVFDAAGVQKGTWILQSYTEKSIEIKPVFAWQVSNHAIFRKAKYFLHMSATICGFEEYKRNLGIVPNTDLCIEMPNPIPVESRKVQVIANQKISGQFDFRQLARNIDTIIDNHKGENGIIHTVSYDLANKIKDNSRYSNKMLVLKNRDEIVEYLSRSHKGNIVLSPSIEKGYDFKGDMSRFQIIAKVPFLFLGDPLVKLNVNTRSDWYSRKTILRLVQACGRSIRGVDDYADTYIMDSNFLRLYLENKKMFPDWFLDAVVMKNNR